MSKFTESVAISVGALCEAFNRTPTEATIQAYVWGLEGLDASEVNVATKAALQQCRFMPSPAELREFALGFGEEVESRAIKAWRAVDSSLSYDTSNYSKIDFDDPIINATIRNLGGVERFMTCDKEEFNKWLRRDFIATYVSLYKNPPDPSELKPLASYHSFGCVTSVPRELPVLRVESKLPMNEKIRELLESRPGPIDRAALGIPTVDLKQADPLNVSAIIGGRET